MSDNVALTFYMHYDQRPSDFWTTRWEMVAIGGPIGSAAENAALDGATALTSLLLDNVIIDRVVLSTVEPDGAIYDPTTVKVISLGLQGTHPILVSNPVDDDIILFIRKNVVSGRTGKMQLRGALAVNMLTTYAGAWKLTNGAKAELTNRLEPLSDWVSDNQISLIGYPLLQTIYPATPEGAKQKPIKVYTDIPIVRRVTSLDLVGPNERQDTQ